jgi:hypothetical protein
MTKIRTLFAGLALALASWLTAGSAYAQNFHSWVSGTGSGNACTRTSPCAVFSIAQIATEAGGVISVLDPGDYGTIFITKSLTIRAEGVVGGATFNTSNGYWINVQAGAGDVVTLEGLHLNGIGGIQLLSGGHLHVVRCVITNSSFFGQAGISFRPNSASKLSDTVISNNGSGAGGGIVINPQSGGTAQVALERVTVNGNAFGVAVDGSSSTGGINMTIADSMIAGNANDGIVATTSSGGAPIGVYVKNTKTVNNQLASVRSDRT